MKKNLIIFFSFIVLASFSYILSKQDESALLINQIPSQENAALLTENFATTLEKTVLEHIREIVYVDQTKILFYIEKPLMDDQVDRTLLSYSFITGDLLKIAENINALISPNSDKIFLFSNLSEGGEKLYYKIENFLKKEGRGQLGCSRPCWGCAKTMLTSCES